MCLMQSDSPASDTAVNPSSTYPGSVMRVQKGGLVSVNFGNAPSAVMTEEWASIQLLVTPHGSQRLNGRSGENEF